MTEKERAGAGPRFHGGMSSQEQAQREGMGLGLKGGVAAMLLDNLFPK